MSPEKNVPVDTAWVFKQFIFEDVLRELDDHFQRLNIDYMPIKGAYLICAGLAKQIRSRTMSDIDILVRERDFDAVVSYFRSIPNVTIAEGSWPVNKKGSRFEVAFYMPFKEQVAMVDIHRSINLRQRFILPPEMLFARGIKQGHRTLPCAEDALVICLCHGLSHAGHFFSDVLFDDVPLLANTSINWEKFWKIANSTGIVGFVYYVLKKIEKKGMILPMRIPKKTNNFTYASILLALSGDRDLSALPPILRRLLIELPFCLDPLGLLVNKCKTCWCRLK
jgi:hypothetical protein